VVVRPSGGDTIPVGPVRLVLHRLGRTAQGPIDTVEADSRGRFDARFVPDSTALYLLSVRYQGIEYFSSPVRADLRNPDTALVIIVADTSSTAPVQVSERTLLVGRPDASGSRQVLDWLVLTNRSERTRVVPDSLRPTWGAALPEQAQNVAVADVQLSQFSPDAVRFLRDSVLVFAPISPGRKELVLQYRIPGRIRRFVAPGAGADSLFVLLEELDARVERPDLVRSAGQQMEGRSFARWTGVLGDAPRIEIAFAAPGVSAGTVLPILLGLVLLAFLTLAAVRLRARAAPAALPNPVGLADAIARLDQQMLEAGDTLTEAERRHYLEERDRLKALLVRALAAPHRHS
jgi:hypothetical protein